MSTVSGRARPTKGYLLELKKRIAFIKEGHKLLEMKRDELAKEIRAYLEALETERKRFEEDAKRAIKKMTITYAFLGSREAESQARSMVDRLDLEVLPKSIMGVHIPYLKDFKAVDIQGKFEPILGSVAREFDILITKLVKIAETEACIDRIAEELGATNRKVNALDKVIIPELLKRARYIEDMLDEEMLEQVVRTKLIRAILVR